MLTADSPCDNVLLEHRLALDLEARGLTEKVYPILIGDYDFTTDTYGRYRWPNLSAVAGVVVKSVEEKLQMHLNRQALGTPMLESMSVKDVMDAVTAHQGYHVSGVKAAAFEGCVSIIQQMVTGDEQADASVECEEGVEEQTENQSQNTNDQEGNTNVSSVVYLFENPINNRCVCRRSI